MPDQSLPATEPDHYAQLAAEVHAAADRIATLAGRGLPAPTSTRMSILASVLSSETAQGVSIVDAVAAAFDGVGADVESSPGSGHWYHLVEIKTGALAVAARATIPTPDSRDARIVKLESELRRLRREAGGAR